MTLLALHYCRSKRASFIKLQLLNGAVRSPAIRERLIGVLNGSLDETTCAVRVEPAFSRNLDLMIGKGLAQWVVASSRLSVEMTARGMEVAEAILANDALFTDEREFLATDGRRVTENVVQRIISAGRRAQL